MIISQANYIFQLDYFDTLRIKKFDISGDSFFFFPKRKATKARIDQTILPFL